LYLYRCRLDNTTPAITHVLASCMKFEDITFYNPSVYHYNLHDKQNCIITGRVFKGFSHDKNIMDNFCPQILR